MTPDTMQLTERLSALRPKLHRYCARMTGSVVDGEDIVQDVFIKVLSGGVPAGTLRAPEAWLFRVAHNAALDFLKQRNRFASVPIDDSTDDMASREAPEDQSEIAVAGLGLFMRIPIPQRSAVIFMDVLGYTLEEIVAITGTRLAAVKSALHRGRAKLRELAGRPESLLPPLPLAESIRLRQYVAHFNAREFDRLRDMLADDVRLDLVGRKKLEGIRDVGQYFHNYSAIHDWAMATGFVDAAPAILVFDSTQPSGPLSYFILIEWSHDNVQSIRDYRYARHVAEGADVRVGGMT